MPSRSNIIDFVKRSIASSKDPRATTATVIRVDGNIADIRLEGEATNIANCRITGDPRSVKVGMLVSIVWEDYNGTLRPSITGGSSGINLSAYGDSVTVDNATIENSQYGLRVKAGGITPAHLSFDINEQEDVLPGWTVSPEGIIYSNDLAINPNGSITLGQHPDVIKISTEDSTYRIWAGDITPASAPFSVSKTGQLISSSAIIAGWTINATEIKKTGIVLDSANDQILVGAASPNIVIDGDGKIIKSSDYQPNASGFGIQASDGFAEFNNVKIRGSLRASVFEYGDIQATAGTLMVSRSAAKLEDDFTSPSSLGSNVNIDVTNDNTGTPLFAFTEDKIASVAVNAGGTGYIEGDVLNIAGGTGGQVIVAKIAAGAVTKVWIKNRGYNYTAGTKSTTGGTGSGCTITITIKDEGDILQIKTLQTGGLAESWFEVQSKSDQGSWARYNCELLSGDTSTTYEKGTGIASLGQHNTGVIYLSADDTIGYSANMSFQEWWRNGVAIVAVVAGGTGYSVGQQLWLEDSSSHIPCKVEITALVGTTTAVSAVTIIEAGSDFSTGTKTTWPVSGVGSGCTISVSSLSNPWTTQTLFGRLGNVRSSYGAPAEDRYGFGFGNYEDGNYISWNAEGDNQFIFSSGEGLMKIEATGLSIEMDDDYTDPAEINWLHKGTTTPGWTMAGQQFEALGVHSQTFSIISSGGADIFDYSSITLSASGDSSGGEDSSVTLHAVNSAAGARNAYAKIASNNSKTWGLLAADEWTMTPGGGTTTRLVLDGTIQVTGSKNPVDDTGVEIAWLSTYGRIISYKRDPTAGYQPLRLGASYIDFYDGATANFRINEGIFYKYFDGAFEATHQVYFDTPNQLWNAVARSSSSSSLTEANLGIPEGCKAVYIRIAARDSGTFPVDTYLAFGRAASDYQVACYPPGSGTGVTNGVFSGSTGWAQLSSGTLNWQVVASGSGTMDTWLWVLGYAM